jgi:MFS family permease
MSINRIVQRALVSAAISSVVCGLAGLLTKGSLGAIAACFSGFIGGAILGSISACLRVLLGEAIGRALGFPLGATLGAAIGLVIFVAVLGHHEHTIAVFLLGSIFGSIIGCVAGGVLGLMALSPDFKKDGLTSRTGAKLLIVTLCLCLGITGALVFVGSSLREEAGRNKRGRVIIDNTDRH